MKSKSKIKNEKRIRRHGRVRSMIFGTENRPRLSIYRSNKAIFAQIINDKKGQTLLSVSDKDFSAKTKTLRAALAGKKIAEAAAGKKISRVIFDRGGFRYTGRIKAFADGAREGGMQF
ncbi:50S ribosomal protein L18 [bacterium]|nr:50S ribosomal protein L18 [bacterium]MCI0566093.1 50S ribosomal protein L18 [bacterium]MCI0679888.1 50S ribosomal protein L18 [bacterium]